MKFKSIFILVVIGSLLLSCKSNPLEIDASKENVSINYINLDSIFVNFSEKEIASEVKKTNLKQGEILDYLLGYCLEVGRMDDTLTSKHLKLFINDPYIQDVEKSIQAKFNDLTPYKKEINQGFKHLRYHFQNGKIPSNIVFINSRFASSIFCTESEIGISLERYLGPTSKVIEQLPTHEFHPWIKNKMDEKYLVRDAITGWISTHYVEITKENLADAIINWGKIIYLTEAAFPKMDPEKLLRYTKDEFDWATKNEAAFWNYLVKEKLLFSINERDFANFLNFGPFTIGLPEKGPDRLGQYLGWKIIHSYMKEHPKTKLEELIKKPYTEIIQAYEIG